MNDASKQTKTQTTESKFVIRERIYSFKDLKTNHTVSVDHTGTEVKSNSEREQTANVKVLRCDFTPGTFKEQKPAYGWVPMQQLAQHEVRTVTVISSDSVL